MNDSPRQPFHDRRLAHARLANQHRVIFRPPGKHLDYATNLLVAPDHRVKLSTPREFREVLRILLQRLELCFRILIRHPLASTHRRQALQHCIVRRPHGREQQLRAVILLAGQRQQKMFRRNVVVLEILSFLKRLVEHLIQRVRRARLRRCPTHFRQLVHRLLRLRLQLADGYANLVEDGRNHALFVAQQDRQQMQR